jgi:hypothetical protein
MTTGKTIPAGPTCLQTWSSIRVLFAIALGLFAFHSGSVQAQARTGCAADATYTTCLPAKVYYVDLFHVEKTFATGNEACISAAGASYGTGLRNAQFFEIAPPDFYQYSGCAYDFHVDVPGSGVSPSLRGKARRA